jgi:hypothetical protein
MNTANITDITLGTSSFNRFFNIEGGLVAQSNHYDINLTSSNKLLENESSRFYNYNTQQYEDIKFDVIIDSVELQTTASGLTFTKTEYHANLLSDIEPTQYRFYNGLESNLEQKISYDVLYGIAPINDVTLSLNTNYAARLLPAISTDIEGTDYIGGASVFKFTSDNTGETELKVAGKNSAVTKIFSWSKDAGSLKITLDGETRSHQFYTLPNGELGLSLTFEEEGVETNTSIYEFSEVTEKNTDITKYMGQFENYYFSFFGKEKSPDLMIGDNGRANVYHSDGVELDDFWKLEEDNSVSLIRYYDCPTAFNSDLDYDACYAQAKTDALDGEAFYIRNYKLLSVTYDGYLFQYRYRAKTSTEDWAYESIRRFKKLAE